MIGKGRKQPVAMNTGLLLIRPTIEFVQNKKPIRMKWFITIRWHVPVMRG